MSFRKKNWVLGASILAASTLIAGCGGSDEMDEDPLEGMGAEIEVEVEVEEEEVLPPPTGAIASIPQTTGLIAFLTGALGDADTLVYPLGAGVTEILGGVEFTCAAGGDDCTITGTVTRDEAGNITDISATWTGGMVTAEFIDPLAEDQAHMNAVNANSVAAIMRVSFDDDAAAAVVDDTNSPNVDESMPAMPAGASTMATFETYEFNDDDTLKERTHTLRDSGTIGGTVEDGEREGEVGPYKGMGAHDMDMVVLSDALDPNGPEFTPNDPTNATYGSTVTSADDNIEIGNMGASGAMGLVGWNHKILHSDWGDSKTADRDGGFETIALIYSNLAAPGPIPFEMVEHAIAAETIMIEGDADARDPGLWFALNGGVVENIDTSMPQWEVPTSTITITVEAALVADVTQVKTMGEQVKGTYFGANGTFTCTSMCIIRRAEIGSEDFTVPDLTPAPAAVEDQPPPVNPLGRGATGIWTFMPDPGAAVILPDQDWLAFGFWLTAPDATIDGVHRVGVFSDGMDEYPFAAAGVSLTGSATYTGSAAGYYVDGNDDGLFTADANLAADFGETDTGTVSGRIDNFKNSMGAYISSDTRGTPNDPAEGGEGDWVVRLSATGISPEGGFVDAADGTTNRMISGSADGVLWTGEWNAKFYGGGDRVWTMALPRYRPCRHQA